MSISVSCPHCRRPYRLKDKFAGKRVKCRECSREFSVPGDFPHKAKRSPSGTAMYRYEPRETEPEIAFEATPFLPDIERHIARTIGPAPMVFHEIVSEDIHVDLHFVPPRQIVPSEDHPLGGDHCTIVTSGMSSKPMHLPRGTDKSLRYAELMISLPADWPGMKSDGSFDDEVMKDEANWWPMRTLKWLARIPHAYQTYFANGHTIPNGDPPEPYAHNTRLCCVMLGPSLLAPRSKKLIINDDIMINFYALYPIYLEEMNFKLRRGTDAFIDKLDAIELYDLVDLKRKNVCKRGFWPFSR